LAGYHFHISSVGRGAGRRATAAAAYRAGERLRDERSGRIYNYSQRRDVLHTEIFLPSHLEGSAQSWASNREKLWNTAEHSEKQSNSRVAREYQVSLPHELTAAQQIALARTFSRELAERFKVAVDLAVHLPRAGGDRRNFHAHLLTTTREVTPKGLGAKAGLELSSRERRRRELPETRQEFISLRERWATLTNEALRDANVDARVDHRSLAARGIDREPGPHIPLAFLKMEQRGVRSEVAERIREDYRRRVRARLERAAQRADVATAAVSTGTSTARDGASEKSARPDASLELKDVDEVRRRAREAWLRLRSSPAEKPSREQRSIEQGNKHESLEREAFPSGRGRDDDLGL
jgi:ATP-dependent exoDNAse (exonuclease V) alpha subunit